MDQILRKINDNLTYIAVSVIGTVLIFGRKLFEAYSPIILNELIKLKHQNLQIRKEKEKLFRNGFEALSVNKTEPLEILELGIGGAGCNLCFYPKNAEITFSNIESSSFISIIQKQIFNIGRNDLKIRRFINNNHNSSELREVETSSVDVVVHTFFLSTVNNEIRMINEIYRVLKPGGVVIFMENSTNNNSNIINKVIQSIVSMVLSLISSTFRVTNIKKVLKTKSPYDRLVIKEEELTSGINFYSPFIFGYGKKNEN
jgi:ubiquinone/menaquinone biosynthesis C-methylase UbiE